MLLLGPPQAQALALLQRVITECLCEAAIKPCHCCPDCVMLQEEIHPDVHVITPEGPSHSIKIDVIRELQADIYQAPQRSSHRFVVFDAADSLNTAAANALLKIVEEPPAHAVYFFIAETLDRIPATLISRCQRYTLSPPAGLSLSTSHAALADDFFAFLRGEADACSLAQSWEAYSLAELLQFLYYLTVSLIQAVLLPQATPSHRLQSLNIHPVHLFMQLDVILQTKQRALECSSLNKTLALESVLLNYLGYAEHVYIPH